jgi:hypothetical protein
LKLGMSTLLRIKEITRTIRNDEDDTDNIRKDYGEAQKGYKRTKNSAASLVGFLLGVGVESFKTSFTFLGVRVDLVDLVVVFTFLWDCAMEDRGNKEGVVTVVPIFFVSRKARNSSIEDELLLLKRRKLMRSLSEIFSWTHHN